MARMYSRKRGKSGSSKPVKKTQPSWLRYKEKEVEMLIVKLSKEGLDSSQIGIQLRDTYGIPDVKIITKKGIAKILKEKELNKELPEDLLNVIKRSIAIRKHLEANHKDQPAKRGLQLTESKIKRLVDYYKSREVLPKDWKYDAKSIRLYAE